MAERPNPGAPKTVSRVKRLGKYELLARIGVGGMAEVYLARQRGPMNFEKVVVVKTIHPHLASEKKFIDMLLDEARIAALIKHPRVVDIYDLGETEGLYFIAMEYLVGQPLSKMIKLGRKGKPLDVLSTAQLIADAADGLHAAHELKSPTGKHLALVHRDVSPGNIIVLYDGSVKLLDFGVSKAVGERYAETQAGKLKGKLGYLAPEQIAGNPVDRRCDIFSLGVVLWEALALTRLFRATTASELMEAMRKWRPDPPSRHRSEVPRELDEICLRALTADPRQRYQTAREMRLALLNLLRSQNYHPDNEIVARYMEDTFGAQRDQQQQLLQQLSEGTRTNELTVSDIHDVKESQPGYDADAEQTAVAPPPTAPVAARPAPARAPSTVMAPGLNPSGRPTSLGLTARPMAPAPAAAAARKLASSPPVASTSLANALPGDTIEDDPTGPTDAAPGDGEITAVSPPPVPPSATMGSKPARDLEQLGVKATLPLGLAGQLKTMTAPLPPRTGTASPSGKAPAASSPQKTDSGWGVRSETAPPAPAASSNGLATANPKATVLDPKPFGANLPPLPSHIRSRRDATDSAVIPPVAPGAVSDAALPVLDVAPAAVARAASEARADDIDVRAVSAWPAWVKPAVIGSGVLLAAIAIALWTRGGGDEPAASTKPSEVAAASAGETETAGADTAAAEPPAPEPAPEPEPEPAAAAVPAATPDAAAPAPAPAPEPEPEPAEEPAPEAAVAAAKPEPKPRERGDDRDDDRERRSRDREREREPERTADRRPEPASRRTDPAPASSKFERATVDRAPPRPAPAPSPATRWDKPAPAAATARPAPAPAPAPPTPTGADGRRRGAKSLAGEYYQAGVSSMVAGDLGGAKRKFRTALSVYRSYAPAYRGLGIAHERSGDRSSAVRAFKQYLRLAPRANDAETIRKRVARLGG